jgi:cbb3-type cytochrome oxidase subunit 3
MGLFYQLRRERKGEREREKATPLTVNQRWKRNKRYMVE